MFIKRLYIGDFGILRNQTLDNLKPSIVLIGGPNRAGKSTLMKALMCLGYGIAKTKDIPPANIEYRIEADLVPHDENNPYHIRLEGLSHPILSSPNPDDKRTLKDFYHVDEFTYKNLFTISLDKLNRVPDGLDNKDLLRLQSVLLGAGLTDIAVLPEIESDLLRDAKKLSGGTSGNITNKPFRPYTNKIQKGSQDKKLALNQMSEYKSEQERLTESENEKVDLESALKRAKAKYEILEVLRQVYDLIESIQETKSSLSIHNGKNIDDSFPVQSLDRLEDYARQYDEAKLNYDNKKMVFENQFANAPSPKNIFNALLKNKDSIEKYYNKLDGLKERWSNIERLTGLQKESKGYIEDRLRKLNVSWSEVYIKKVENLQLQLFEEHKLIESVNSFKDQNEELAKLIKDRNQIKEDFDILDSRKDEWKASSLKSPYIRYINLSIIAALLGVVAYFIHPLAGILIGVFGIAGAAVFSLMRNSSQESIQTEQQKLDSQLMTYSQQLDRINKEINGIREEFNENASYLDSVKEELGLQDNIPMSSIPDYYRTISDLQVKIRGYKADAQELDRQGKSIHTELDDIIGLLNWLKAVETSGLENSSRNIPQRVGGEINFEDIEFSLKSWYAILKNAIEIKQALSVTENLEEKLRDLMKGFYKESPIEKAVEQFILDGKYRTEFIALQDKLKSDDAMFSRLINAERVFKATNVLEQSKTSLDKNDVDIKSYFIELYNSYASKDDLDEPYLDIKASLADLQEKIEEKANEIQKIKINLEGLSSTASLNKAHADINEGRAELYPLIYRFAVLKTAAWLSKDMRSNFLDKMQDELLSNAEAILNELTSGDYRGISPSEDISHPDFTFALSDGDSQSSVDVLSRGTKEQVFLAVRLGRIMGIKPSLPVIIDDSFVNFDPRHLKNSIKIINNLGQTNQVFILTCHPNLVRDIREVTSDCQCWLIDNGQISLSDADALIGHLNNKSYTY